MGVNWSAKGDWIDGISIYALVDLDITLYAVSVKGNVLRSADFEYTWDEVGDWGSAPQGDFIGTSGWIDVLVCIRQHLQSFKTQLLMYFFCYCYGITFSFNA